MNTTKTPRNKMTGFAMRGGLDFDDITVKPPSPASSCRYCGEDVEAVPMAERTCYACYRAFLPTLALVAARRERDIAAFADETERMKQAAEISDIDGWLGEPPVVTCEHSKGRSAEGSMLRCAECNELYEPRDYSEQSQVAMYGNGQSLKGYTKVDTYERELGVYHDGETRT